MIRPARFGDIPRMAELLAEMHARSIYVGRGTFEVRELKGWLMSMIQRHGSPHPGGTLVNVAEQNGVVEGFLVGLLDRCYHLMRELSATDVFFYVSERGDPRDATRLLEAFLKWAMGNERVIEVKMGATNAIADPDRTARLYERAGLQKCGVIYELRRAT